MRPFLLLACTLPLLVAAPAAAQPPFHTDEFSGVTLYPAPGMGDYLMVDGAVVAGYDTPHLGLWLDYADQPVDIITQCDLRPELPCETLGDRVEITSSITTLFLTGALTIADRMQLGVILPVSYSTGDGMPFSSDGMFNNDIPGGSGGGIADPRLRLKAHLLGNRRPGIALSIVAWGSVPLGQTTAEKRFLGDDGPNAGGHAVVELLSDEWRFALNLGGFYRPVRSIVATEVGPMMSYAGALEVVAHRQVSILAEVTGATGFAPARRTDQLEARLAGRLQLGDFRGTLGFGVGLIYGPGVPTFRILLGGGWAGIPEVDTDGDGLFDRADACPDVAEDEDDYQDEDGCPEPDNDGDGIADADDRCPDEAEDVDEHEDEDGCLDEDNDGDGVRDGYDSCPDTPEDMDGDRDTDGCPDGDRDGDGIDDERDQCPDDAEDTDGLGDADGCPEEDYDEDGVPDERDECAEDPEDRDGFQDRDGCPEEGGRIRATPAHG